MQSDNEPSAVKTNDKATKAGTSTVNPKPAKTSKQITQSIAPAQPYQPGNSDPHKRIDNSLMEDVGEDSWIAKIALGGMTNAKALKVLATIERKLAGECLCQQQ